MLPLLALLLIATMKRVDLVKIGGFKAGENLVASEVPKPSGLGPNEVVVEIKAAAVNPIDWKQAVWGILIPKALPASLGCDISGVVVDCGPDAASWRGKRVLAYLGADKSLHATDKGAFAEQVVVDADLVAEFPDCMTFQEAATIPVGALTAGLLLDAVSAKESGWLVVYGASSSVGFNAVQLAAKRGYRVIAVASVKHEATLRELGASGFVDYRNDDFDAKVRAICGQDKLVGAVDCIGEAPTFAKSASIVKDLGGGAVKLVVATTSMSADAPEPVVGVSVNLGSALDRPGDRKLIGASLPTMTALKTMPVRLVKGPVSAETVEKAFQVSKDGVSGEKVVIEWTE
jgi:NADPH:quinone reductase-like Zn-dependent oxidoreductase